ncbi:MAG: polysaccharide biosynthesis protein [Candidatus Margulisiibacteriota bacterium]|nr:MAG: polysaccharide biosynthesis protein [Candidatus Margulisbacteria bacterium GWD2_39_127]OGI00939.1 MAG: polysaccharide biosynthesis protein [Candidatus Margulisbacteria bacterium GWF2_38_17]OGI09934.1 MAG: polysaccharide biosynthesis protein [Candidatus Margulisbacteria bacterium GWE2_39_32]PZM77233.1 MAG: polysaccharide biosynthesis protein [Candidatus Margulisiibacteriota bacterium]HAR64239.1 polysaccharide biosynthesis protein [Candidatus Margulisiibacteriota bacterium]
MQSLSYFFLKGSARSIKAKINIVASIFLKGASVGITLLLVPLTLSYLNPTKYGIWLTLSSLIGWFGYFDIGLGNGLRNKFAQALAKNDSELARKYVSTTYALLIMIVSTLYVLFLFLNPFIDWSVLLNTDYSMKNELSRLALIVSSFFALRFVCQLVNVVLVADQKPSLSYSLSILSNLFSLIVIYLLVKYTAGSLLYLGFAASSIPVIVLLTASAYFFFNTYKKVRPSIKYVDFSDVNELAGLGVQFFIIQISIVIVYSTDNIIISQLFGPEEVTSYNIAFKYFSLISMVFGIVLAPFWSAYTEAYLKNDLLWIKRSVNGLIRLWLLFSIVTFFMIVFSNYFYSLWVGDSVKVPFLLSIMMGVFVVISMWTKIFSNFSSGVGKLRLQFYEAIIIGVINIPLSIFLAKQLNIGPAGVMLSTILCLLGGAIWTPIQYHKLIKGKATGIWAK